MSAFREITAQLSLYRFELQSQAAWYFMNSMECARRNTLVNQWDTIIEEYSEAVRNLGGLSFTIAKDAWLSAFVQANRARIKCAEILERLKRHEAEHGC